MILLVVPSQALAQIPEFLETWRWNQFTAYHGLPPGVVSRLVETTEGVVWTQTGDDLLRFDGYQWNAAGESSGLPAGRITRLLPDLRGNVIVILDGVLYHGGSEGFKRQVLEDVKNVVPLEKTRWIVHLGDTLVLFDQEQGRLLPATWSTPLGDIRMLARTRKGNVWVNSTEGLFMWSRDEWILKMKSSTRPLAIQGIVEDPRGNGVLSVANPYEYRGLWEWGPESSPRYNPAARGGDNILSMSISPGGDVLALHQSGHIRVRKGGTWSGIDPVPSQLRNAHVVYFRANGDFLAGAEGAMFVYRNVESRWSHQEYGGSDPRDIVNAILRTKTGDLWLGTSDGVIVRRNDGREDWMKKILNVSLGAVTGLAEDGGGNLWVTSGANFPGAFRWDGKRWSYFGAGQGLNAPFVHKVRIDRKGRAWFLGIGDRMGDEEREPGAFVRERDVFVPWGRREGLKSGRIYDFVEDEVGAFWFATAAGISRWSGKWKHWGTADGLKSDPVFVLATDTSGGIWFGDRGSGLGRIRSDDSVQYLTTAGGLIHNNVYGLARDEAENLWIATHGGLSKLKNGSFVNFGTSSGLRNRRLWPLMVEPGVVLAGTHGNGLAILKRSGKEEFPPNVLVEKVIVEGNDVLLRWKPYSYWEDVPREEIDTRVRIDNQAWSKWTRAREMTLTDIESGTYSVTVQARGFFGDPGPESTPAVFQVTDAFYEMPVFYVPLGTLVAAFLALWMVTTARKRKQDRALQESRLRIETIVTRSPVILFSIDTKSVITLIEGKGLEYLHLTADQIIGKNIEDFSSEMPDLASLFSHSFEHEEFSTVLVLRGRVLDVHTSKYYDDHGSLEGIIGVAVDITELRKAEAERYQSDVRYRELFEQANDAIYIIAADSEQILEANPSACALYGFDQEEFIGSSLELLTEDLRRGKETIKTILSQGQVHNFESLHHRKGGTPIHVVINASRIDYRGKPAILVIARDVTEQRMLQRQLIEAQKIQSLGTLAGGIAHDFNNILGIIMGFASLSEVAAVDGTKIRGHLDAIKTASERGAALVQQILTFARKKDVQLVTLDINQVIRELEVLLRETFPKTISVELELDGSIPAIAGDKTQLHQALLNLFVNARDAMTQGGNIVIRTDVQNADSVRFHFPQASAASYVQVSVADNGEGIGESVLERIFDPFFTTKEIGKGTGLGLAVVYGIVSGHRGHIRVESKVGKGTTVTMLFPALELSSPKPQDEGTMPEDLEKGTETVLIVEDEELLRELLSVMLEERGYTVLLASDGNEGVLKYAEHKEAIDLVLLDMGLPGISGFDTYQQIRNVNPAVAAIICSGFFDPDQREQMVTSGIRAFVQKPYDPATLLRTIRSVLSDRADSTKS